VSTEFALGYLRIILGQNAQIWLSTVYEIFTTFVVLDAQLENDLLSGVP